jgi:aldehyde dehydrogenase (NAD+)/phenylacetaldehyde dehydrogenase
MRTDLFIDNEWRSASKGKTFPVVNPATEEVIADVQKGDAADIAAAVAAARKCFDSDAWRGMTGRKRARLLFKAADLLQERRDEIAKLETLHNGKTFFESKIEIAMTVETLRYYAGWADKLTGNTLPVDADALVYTLKEPVGVVGAIVPWNFPLNLASWKIGPALAAGCTVVLKPASETPLTALAFAGLLQEAGYPEGAFNVVPGAGSTAGSALVDHPEVDKIAFTGSTGVGRQIMVQAAATNKRISLELGGKSPNILFADADIDAAAKGALTGIFYGKGEVCAAGSRLLVEKSVHGEVVDKLAAWAPKLAPGDPFDKKTRMGALVSSSQRDTVLGFIRKGIDEGGKVVAGGKSASWNGKGYFVEATVFDGVTPDMTIAREEIFGPVLAVLPFEDAADAVRLANQSAYGLASGIWTGDIKKAHRVARDLEAGTVWINTYHSYDPAAPFGGYKASGFGRELGRDGLDSYLETKTVWVNLG